MDRNGLHDDAVIAQNKNHAPVHGGPRRRVGQGFVEWMGEFQLAWPIEVLDTDKFIDRWANWLADAAQSRLHAPSTMPERATPRNWRQK